MSYSSQFDFSIYPVVYSFLCWSNMGERQLLRHFNRRIEILTATINELSEAVRDLQTYMDTEVESMEELMEAQSLLFDVLGERIRFSKELALYKGLRYILLNDEI